MDHSRSPRRYHNAGGQVSYYPPLSDEAYQELRPDWQSTLTDIEISNQRAAELTAARAELAAARAEITRLSAGIAEAVRGHMFYHDEYGASIPLEALRTQLEQVEAHMQARMIVNAPQPVTRPFSGEGRRLDE